MIEMSAAAAPVDNTEFEFPERRRFARRVNALFLALGLILAAIAFQVYQVVGDFVEATQWVTHSMSVRQEITLSLASLHDAEASQRAYLISANAERLADFSAAVPRVAEHSAKLSELVADNPEQADNARSLAILLDARLSAIHEVLELFGHGGIDAARASAQMGRSRAEDFKIDSLGERMLHHEEQLQSVRERRTAEQAMLTRFLTVGAILFSVIMLGVALLLVQREQRHRVTSMREALSANRELLRSLGEAQRLGQSLRELAELGEMLQGCREVNEAATGLSISLPRLLPGSSGSVHLINASQNLIQALAHWGQGTDDKAEIFTPDDCWALRRGHAYPLSGTAPAFTCRHLKASMEAHPTQDHLCVPMIAQGEILGVISVTSENEIYGSERSNIIAACESISMALANLKLQETLRIQSLRDPRSNVRYSGLRDVTFH